MQPHYSRVTRYFLLWFFRKNCSWSNVPACSKSSRVQKPTTFNNGRKRLFLRFPFNNKKRPSAIPIIDAIQGNLCYVYGLCMVTYRIPWSYPKRGYHEFLNYALLPVVIKRHGRQCYRSIGVNISYHYSSGRCLWRSRVAPILIRGRNINSLGLYFL
jgi:hypothetical protein